MAKTKKTIEIPVDLARLLVAEETDFKEPSKFEEVRAVAIGLLKVLLEVNK